MVLARQSNFLLMQHVSAALDGSATQEAGICFLAFSDVNAEGGMHRWVVVCTALDFHFC